MTLRRFIGAFCAAIAFGVSNLSVAQAPAAIPETAAPAADAKPAYAATPAESAPTAPAAKALTPNKGDTAWMMVSTLLVIMMTVPGLALFYGGLVRSKNVLSVLMQVMVTFSLVVVLWLIYGYSFAFTEGNAFFGGGSRLFGKGLFDKVAGTFAMAATFSKGVVIPEHHLCADRRLVRRAHEVLSRFDFYGDLVHLQLHPDRPYGVVLAGS